MKIVHISDTHGLHRQIDFSQVEADVLVHSGDFLIEGRDSGYKEFEFEAFMRWFSDLPFKHKILIAGNHDWFCFEAYRNRSPLKQTLFDTFGIHYLVDEAVTLDGVKFWGSPWQPEFMNWAFNLPINGTELKQKWQAIADDTQVLITHGPALGHLDMGSPQKRALGCELLRQRLAQLPQLKLHLFGHIHEAYGVKQVDQIHFYNSAYLNVQARFGDYPPIIDFSSL